VKRRPWTDAEIALLRATYPHTETRKVAELVGHPLKSTYQKARLLKLGKSAAFFASDASGRIKHGATKGAGTRFGKGQAPWNKGTHFEAGGKSVLTRFPPGIIPHNYAPIGSLRVTTVGYLQRKVTDTGYPPADWVSVHKLVWQAAHGPVPEGHVVAFKPGRRTTVEEEITLDALELVSKQDLMARNTVQNLPPELRDTVRALSTLRRVINNRSKR